MLHPLEQVASGHLVGHGLCKSHSPAWLYTLVFVPCLVERVGWRGG